MPIYPEHRLIHIHIPKTGGTAIAESFHALGDLRWTPEFWIGQQQRNGRWYEYQHLTMLELRALAGADFHSRDSFVVVRNPYARLVSDYVWRQGIRRDRPHSATRFFDSFDLFLQAIPEDMGVRWLDHIQRADQAEANFLIHVRPQYQYVYDVDGRLLVDELVRFENFGREINRLLTRYGVSMTARTPPRARDLAPYYNRQLLDRVNEIYARDFECFSYERL